MNQDTYY